MDMRWIRHGQHMIGVYTGWFMDVQHLLLHDESCVMHLQSQPIMLQLMIEIYKMLSS